MRFESDFGPKTVLFGRKMGHLTCTGELIEPVKRGEIHHRVRRGRGEIRHAKTRRRKAVLFVNGKPRGEMVRGVAQAPCRRDSIQLSTTDNAARQLFAEFSEPVVFSAKKISSN